MNGSPNELEGPNRKASRWTAATLVGVVLLFAAGMLQFATIRYHHRPAQERVNNGSEATFFAFHISPSYNFSEDFHLYYVRAKRIAERGWTDSLFYSRPDERSNYAAPLQVVYGWLALATEGSPRRYAVLIFATLAAGWTILVVSARRWLPREISSVSILMAVLVTVLFEALHLTVSEPTFNSFGQWPTFRALRMSTMSWTSPVLLALLIGLASLVFDRRRWVGTLTFLALMLAALLGTDNWAFAIAWVASGLVTAWITLTAVRSRLQTGQWPYAAVHVCCGMAVVIVATFWGHEQLNSSLEGDALLRGGFGAEWRDAAERKTNVVEMQQWVARYALLPLLGVLLFSFAEPRVFRTNGGMQQPLAPTSWAVLRALAALPIATILVLNFGLQLQGMEPFLRNQLYWRADYCLLFALILAAAEWLRTSLPIFSGRWKHSWAIAVGVGLTALFAYHNYRIHWFVSNVAARDFFLTADAQGMKPWLEKFDREHDRYELATASVELNYLCAFWTDADLLLPSGFPYHNGASNAEIEERAMQLVRLYGATQETWLKFTKPTSERFTDLWSKSRARASGRGYLYHMFHRWTYFRPREVTKFTEHGRLDIGKALTESTANSPLPSPEVILIDDVSRSLGRPNLLNYVLAHRSGSIEAWVRCDLAVATASNTSAGAEEIRR